VLSIDLANLVAAPLPEESITFVGRLVGGGVVTQTFQLAAQTGAPFFRRFQFDPAFTNLETLFFQPPGFQGYQFTNVTFASDGGPGGVNIAPEPATVALTATGVGLLAFVARRRRLAALR
jgi:hypothetical protein